MAFPSVADDVRVEPTDDSPIRFAHQLAGGPTPEDALSFCAYLLPRREAVWWSCQCVRALVPTLSEQEIHDLNAAETWVREPDDTNRRAALELGTRGNRNFATTWITLAVGWSGGTIPVGNNVVSAAPHLAARAVRIAVLTTLARVAAKDRARQIQACLTGAMRLLGG